MTRTLRLLALLPLLAAVACGSGSAADDDQLGSATAPSQEPVLQIRHSGGFMPVGWDFRTVPAVSVYDDGRVIAPGPQIDVFPGPALPSVQVGRLRPEQVQRLVQDGLAALEGGTDYGQPPIADAPTTVVAVGSGADREVVSAAALAETSQPAAGEGGGLEAPSTTGLTPEQQQARERLSTYVAQVQEVVGSVPSQPFAPEALAVLALPYGEVGMSEGDVPAESTWPGPALADGEQLASGRCVVVRQELAAVREAAAQASQETPWVDDGQRWRLSFRPLLPDERTCQDVLGGPTPTGP